MSDSIWKKEISFSRKAKAPRVEQPAVVDEPPAEPKQSIWKREISLGGKAKEPKPAKAAAEPKQSLLKKEISLSRKPKAPRVEQPAVVVEAAAEPKQSIWKREIGGKAKTPKPAAEPSQSVWKKDISLSRGKKTDRATRVDDPIAQLAALAAQAVAPDFGAPVPEPVARPTELAETIVAAQVAEPEPVAPESHLAEPLLLDVAADVEPPAAAAAPVEPPAAAEAPVAAAPPVEPAPAVETPVGPLPEPAQVEPVFAEAPVAAPLPELPPVEAAAAVPTEDIASAAPYVVEPDAAEQWLEPVAPVESWLAEPALPPVPEADTAVVVHPPVPAAELPPLPAEPKQPFWKKELSFSRKPKPAAAAAAPAQVAAGVHPPVPAAELPALPQAKQPFWKKELSLSRKPKPSLAAAPRSKASFSLPSFSLPSFSRGGRSGGHHQVKRLVGLKVGGSQLAAARIANNGAAELLQVARTDLASGIVVAGELRDPDSLAEALKAFFAANKLPRKNVRLGIASNRIGVRMFDIAGIEDAKQLENAIHFRAQETLPIPLDEAVLDYRILEEKVDEEGNSTKRVLLVVAYRELVDRYVSACRKAGITLTGIDLEAFALLRALSAPRPADQPGDSALVAVAVGHDRSTFAVSDGRVCEFTRVLDWGGAQLNVAIARALNLAPSEAEGIKRVVSLLSNDVPEGLAPEHYALALDAVRKQVQAFARELVSSLQFYQNQPGSLGIGEIVITGGTANLAGLAEELQRLIGVRVRVGDPLARLKLAKKIVFDGSVGSLAVAIGLGIED